MEFFLIWLGLFSYAAAIVCAFYIIYLAFNAED